MSKLDDWIIRGLLHLAKPGDQHTLCGKSLEDASEDAKPSGWITQECATCHSRASSDD